MVDGGIQGGGRRTPRWGELPDVGSGRFFLAFADIPAATPGNGGLFRVKESYRFIGFGKAIVAHCWLVDRAIVAALKPWERAGRVSGGWIPRRATRRARRGGQRANGRDSRPGGRTPAALYQRAGGGFLIG